MSNQESNVVVIHLFQFSKIPEKEHEGISFCFPSNFVSFLLCIPLHGFVGPLFRQNKLGGDIISLSGRGNHPQNMKTVASLVTEQIIEELLTRSGRIFER